jgi:hypothetical protein
MFTVIFFITTDANKKDMASLVPGAKIVDKFAEQAAAPSSPTFFSPPTVPPSFEGASASGASPSPVPPTLRGTTLGSKALSRAKGKSKSKTPEPAFTVGGKRTAQSIALETSHLLRNASAEIRGLRADLADVEDLAGIAARPAVQTGGRAVDRFVVKPDGQASIASMKPFKLGTDASGQMTLRSIDTDAATALKRVSWDYTHQIPREMYLNEAIVSDWDPPLADKHQFYKLNDTKMDFARPDMVMYRDAPIVKSDPAVSFGSRYLAGGFQDPANPVISNITMNMPPVTTFDKSFTKIGVQA